MQLLLLEALQLLSSKGLCVTNLLYEHSNAVDEHGYLSMGYVQQVLTNMLRAPPAAHSSHAVAPLALKPVGHVTHSSAPKAATHPNGQF